MVARPFCIGGEGALNSLAERPQRTAIGTDGKYRILPRLYFVAHLARSANLVECSHAGALVPRAHSLGVVHVKTLTNRQIDVIEQAHRQASGDTPLTRQQMAVVETVVRMANEHPEGLLMPVVRGVGQMLGKAVPASTVSRWHRIGVKSPGGEVVKLRVERVGGRFFTRPDWLSEFVRKTTGRLS